MLRLKLKRFLRQRGLSETDLANAIADALIDTREGVSERHLRYITQNTEPLTNDNRDRKPSLVMLGFIIKGLRQLTGEDVTISDIIEYLTDGIGTPRTEEPVEEPAVQPADNPSIPSQPAYDLVLLGNDAETDELLDEVWELTVHSLKQKGHAGLGSELLAFTQARGETHDHSARTRRSRRNALPLVLLVLLLASVAFISYEQFVMKPRLLAQYAGLFSFRDRIRPTSKLPVPTLIGPEGDIDQLAPILRVNSVSGAIAYEFYVENLVSDDNVYTGPIPNNTFPIPEHTLCPNTSYSWRARALGNDGWTSFSSPVQFTVSERAASAAPDLVRLADIKTKPVTPILVAPIGTTSTTTPTLELSHDPDALGYGFYIRDLREDRIIYSNSFATEHQVTLPAGMLEDGGIYQWNARSRNCHYWSDFTPTQIFTVNTRD